MKSNGISILYKNSFVVHHLLSVFNIVMFLYRNYICLLMTMRAIVIAQFYCQISIFRLVKNQRLLHRLSQTSIYVIDFSIDTMKMK